MEHAGMQIRLKRALQVAALGMLVAGPAMADPLTPSYAPPGKVDDFIASPITDTLAIRASYIWESYATNGRVDDTTNITNPVGTPFSLENDFGMSDKSQRLGVEIVIRMRERNKLRVNMLDVKREGTATITGDFTYGNTDFQTGDLVYSRFDWRQMDFTWTDSFLQGRSYELGAGLGLHLVQADAQATAPARNAREHFDGAGPFVTVAVDGTWRFTNRFSFSARGQYMHLAINDITGTLGIYHADLQFRWRPNLAIGLGYESSHTQLIVKNQNPSGLLQMNMRGPELFLRASL
ncbi:MAG TPA: hypothetical protein VMI92_07515 [Steroidobacteraceae bacterium]|nr:hypothetical protein [Steroidobacteraceae bacterium]